MAIASIASLGRSRCVPLTLALSHVLGWREIRRPIRSNRSNCGKGAAVYQHHQLALGQSGVLPFAMPSDSPENFFGIPTHGHVGAVTFVDTTVSA